MTAPAVLHSAKAGRLRVTELFRNLPVAQLVSGEAV